MSNIVTHNFLLFLAVTTSKGRAKKNPTKVVAKPEEVEIKKQNGKEQNAAIQEDNSKTKTAKKGNKRKAAPRKKVNAAVEKADEAEAEEAAIPEEEDVKENGEVHVAELKQKKRNAGKANAMNGKVEAKGKQKKGQTAAAATASADEEEETEDVIIKNDTTEMNAPEIDENDTKDVSLSKDDSMSQNEEIKEVEDSKADSINDEPNEIGRAHV